MYPITGQDSEVLTLEEDQMQDHQHDISDPGHTHPYQDQHNSAVEDAKWSGDEFLYHGNSDTAKVTSPNTTGVTVTGVSSSYRHGDETRPKNMNVIYIIRVY